MGLVHAICQSRAYKDEYVPAGSNYSRGAPSTDGVGQVHMLICGLNYKGTGLGDLKAVYDAELMQDLAATCGVGNVRMLLEKNATLDALRSAICQMGSQTGPDDFFVFFFSGHGSSIPDDDGDEEDGFDEALVCYPTFPGDRKIFYRDDDFAEDVSKSVAEGARVLIIADCCHSGTIADFGSKPHLWDGIEAMSIAGCEDHHVGEDTGKGGILTLAMLYAVEALQDLGEPYSVGKLFNATLREDELVFSSEQSLQLNCSADVAPDRMAWPLLPLSPYESSQSRVYAAARRPGTSKVNALAQLGL
mmetsp:Transcript_12345/g.28985  ORF Transcript_12345/g.28985 Transcript_12345/m.28985 type:complete len:304 (-) Transcript_12345:170-1081(-)